MDISEPILDPQTYGVSASIGPARPVARVVDPVVRPDRVLQRIEHIEERMCLLENSLATLIEHLIPPKGTS